MGRVLGVDYGSKRIGLALSDLSGLIARPLAVVDGEAELFTLLPRLVEEEEVETVVIGLPRNMDGSLGPKAREVLEFKARLEERTDLPVETWDERLTTVQAERALRDGGLSRGKRGRRVDKVAAQILLQSYLDRARGAGHTGGGSSC